MTAHRQPPLLDRRRFLVAGLGAALAACAGVSPDPGAAVAAGRPSADPGPPSGPPPTPTAPTPTAPDPTAPDPTPGRPTPSETDPPEDVEPSTYPTGIVPVRIAIPAIGVDARVTDLRLTADEVEVPTDFDEAGWWVQTREPGEIGPAVIGGHVDSRTGPAVFFRLEELRVGDEVVVADASGETRSFVVDAAPVRVRKDARPPEVFGFGQGRPELRLITCGGAFDPTTGHYVDNVVVFCHTPPASS